MVEGVGAVEVVAGVMVEAEQLRGVGAAVG
jgi:hypothetical protein